jgi:hypothetical protein
MVTKSLEQYATELITVVTVLSAFLLSVVVLSVVMLNITMLNAVMLNFIMLSVTAPKYLPI